MDQVMPFGVKFVRIINVISMVLLVIVGVLLAMIAVPNIMKAAHDAGRSAHPVMLIVVGLISCCIGWVPAYLLALLNKALAQLKPAARIWQIVISILSLGAFPIGTILNVIVLYFMLFDAQTRNAFDNKPK